MVIQLTESGQVIARFKSIAEASRVTGFKYDRILACVNGKKKTYKGYVFVTNLSNLLKAMPCFIVSKETTLF